MQESQDKKTNRPLRRPPPALPKVIGCDAEVANFFTGLDEADGAAREASRAIIREIRGHPDGTGALLALCAEGYAAVEGCAAEDPRDHDRAYLAETGGCFYIDLDHVEVCLPETTSAFDYVACWHAALKILRRALEAANARLPGGQKIHVLVNTSDGHGHSYGSHLNFLITERCRQNIFERRVHHLLFLAAYQVSSILFTGQGKVGSERDGARVDYQLSQRADFFERIVGAQTTCARPIVNSRDEPLCGTTAYRRLNYEGAESDMARLHVIFFDSTLCHVSSLLKAGAMQIVLAMIEAEAVNPRLILEDPVAALRTWSKDPTLRAQAFACTGRRTTAVDLQYRFLDEAARFAARGGCDGIVPRAAEILELWADTLDKLKARDLPALAGRLDWVSKRLLLEAVLGEREDLHWRHPAIKQLDQLYASLDPDEGLFWNFDRQNLVERVVSEGEIDRFTANPPEDTRAWTRAMLLRRGGMSRISGLDWDYVRCVVRDGNGFYEYRTVDLANPLGFTRSFSERIFDRAASFDAVVDALQTAVCERSSH